MNRTAGQMATINRAERAGSFETTAAENEIQPDKTGSDQEVLLSRHRSPIAVLCQWIAGL